MKLSRFSDYALRILMFGAIKGAEFRVDEVTDAYGISRNHVAKVIQTLAQLGYLQTRRGRGGGIRLARPPAEIRIGQVVRETEDQPVIVECFDAATNTCPINGSCLLKGALAEAMRAFYASLDRHNLQALVSAQPERMAAILLRPAANSGRRRPSHQR